MSDDSFLAVDFLPMDGSKSGDAIPLWYRENGVMSIHVVDGGFTDTGQKVIEHINEHYDASATIDRVVLRNL